MKDGHNGLTVLDHVAVEFHHFPLFSGAQEQDGHSGGVWVPDFSPTCGGLAHQLTDGHVRNHCGYSHLCTAQEEAVPTFTLRVGGFGGKQFHGMGQFSEVNHASSRPSYRVVAVGLKANGVRRWAFNSANDHGHASSEVRCRIGGDWNQSRPQTDAGLVQFHLQGPAVDLERLGDGSWRVPQTTFRALLAPRPR